MTQRRDIRIVERGQVQKFGFHLLITILSYVILGGRNSFAGPLIGTAILIILPELARPLAENMGGAVSAQLPARVGDLEVQLSGAAAGSAQIPAPEPAPKASPEGPESEEAVKAVRAWLNER